MCSDMIHAGNYDDLSPPLTGKVQPVMNEAASEARNRAAAATSSGLPHRASSDSRCARSCQACEALLPQLVLIQPGAIQLTRTSGASDLARLLEYAITAP